MLNKPFIRPYFWGRYIGGVGWPVISKFQAPLFSKPQVPTIQMFRHFYCCTSHMKGFTTYMPPITKTSLSREDQPSLQTSHGDIRIARPHFPIIPKKPECFGHFGERFPDPKSPPRKGWPQPAQICRAITRRPGRRQRSLLLPADMGSVNWL